MTRDDIIDKYLLTLEKEAISSLAPALSSNTAPGATPADAAKAAVCFKKFPADSAE